MAPAPAPAPSVVVGGPGDSGTTAIIAMLHRLGLVHCNDRNDWLEPPWVYRLEEPEKGYSTTREAIIKRLLELGNGRMSQESYRRYDEYFQRAVDLVTSASTQEYNCIVKQQPRHRLAENAVWGWKEPHYGWLLPVMDAAFELRTKYVIVARDPRDICSSRLQDQYTFYGKELWSVDCWAWWAGYWRDLLDGWEGTDRMKVVRIEDLVMPEPAQDSTSFKTLHCLLNFTGLASDASTMMVALTSLRDRAVAGSYGRAAPPDHDLLGELGGFHDHSYTYMGHHYNQTEETRQKLESGLASRPAWIHKTMQRLGYDPMHFGLLQPESRSVCGS